MVLSLEQEGRKVECFVLVDHSLSRPLATKNRALLVLILYVPVSTMMLRKSKMGCFHCYLKSET